MADVKNVQLPVEHWILLKELAEKDGRTIAAYTRVIIKQLHEQTFAVDDKKA